MSDIEAHALCDAGFEAEFYGPQRDILLERGRLARRERGRSPRNPIPPATQSLS